MGKVWVSKAGNGAFTQYHMAAADPPGGGDPGWPGLVDFLSVASLEGEPLDRVLTLLMSYIGMYGRPFRRFTVLGCHIRQFP